MNEGNAMGAGIRALMHAAQDGPLPFAVSMYCGQMVVTGTVAPADWWYEVTRSAAQATIREDLKRVRKDAERQALMDARYGPFEAALDQAWTSDDKAPDELTLIDVYVYPAVGTQGTRSGGQHLPTARIPLSAIDLWWIVSGEELQGRGGSQVGFGFLFPA
jgi:hypothetical protein